MIGTDIAREPAANLLLRISASVLERLQAHHLAPDKRVESLSYAFAHASPLRSATVVCIGPNNPVVLLAADCFERQSGGALRLRQSVLNGLLVEFAGSPYNCLINVHDHWFSEVPTFSAVDDADDLQFDRYIRERFEPMLLRHPHIGAARPIFNLSVVLGQRGLDARLVHTRGKAAAQFIPVTRATTIGATWRPLATGAKSLERKSMPDCTGIYERHQDFLGATQQTTLANLHVAIAGCGGLGSILAEALVRLGVGHLTLVDDDTLASSNLNRWQGARPSDVGKSKAKLLASRMRLARTGATVNAVHHSIYSAEAQSALAVADIIIGGVDNDEARWFLNKVSLQYLVPYFDGGVKIDLANGTDFRSRFFAVLPGAGACVDCTQVSLVDRDTTLQSFLNPVTAAHRRAAGYIEQAPAAAAPSVYPLNMQAASTLLIEFLNFVAAWRPTATVASSSWSRGGQRADRQNFPEVPAADCPSCSHLTAVGSSEKLHRPQPQKDLSDLTMACTVRATIQPG